MTQTARPSRAQTPTRVYVILMIGVFAASLAAIFIRFAQDEGVPSLVIAAGRLIISALILTPPVLRRHRVDLQRLGRRDLLLATIAGFWLAVHFTFWITSLEYTSV
ncbi:MAG: EamA/RhaT family transporter, partial [Chloroflexi bacterium]|nr:EamA/RhaT family transporter [Chloroflexota bacterium]